MGLENDVVVRRRFQRAIRLDTDLVDPLALQGFVCPPTFASALTTLSQQVKDAGHGAFTWTGPFGGGKSSLAVVLSALLTAPGAQRQQDDARGPQQSDLDGAHAAEPTRKRPRRPGDRRGE